MNKYLAVLVILAAGCSHYQTDGGNVLTAIQIQDRNGFTETISSPDRLVVYQNMDFLESQPYKKVLRIFKNQGKNCSIITAYHPNGTIAQYLETKEMRANGSYREWFPSGQIKIDSFVIGGTADIIQGAQRDWLFDGMSQVWDEDGHIVAQIPYEKGDLQGTSIYFYPDGTQRCLIPYIKNMEEGERTDFFPNGDIKAKVQFEKGRQEGRSMGYFSNQKLAWQEEYREGLLVNGLYYNNHSEQIAEVVDGRGIQARYDGDSISFLLEVRQGTPEGFVKKVNKFGELIAQYSLKNGKKHGEEVAYFRTENRKEKPLQKLSIHWDQGTIHGIVKTWYPNGQLQSQREYARNQKLGPSCAWYNNGSLMLVEEYEEGTLMKGAYYKKNQDRPISTVTNGTGIAYMYDEDGIFLKKIHYEKGKPADPQE